MQDLPCIVERIGDGNVLKGGQCGKPAREHHLVDIVGGRLVGRGVEIVGLRIGAVLVDDDGIGAEQRLFVDDIHRERRAGKSVCLLEIFHKHVAVRVAVLPCGVHAVVGGRSACSVAPDDAVAHIAELPRRIYHARSSNIRLDEHAVVILLVSAHLLLDHRIDVAVHLSIVVFLPHETGVHVADIFERGVHIGRRAVRRKFIGDGDKALVHDVRTVGLEKERVHAKNAETENCRSGKTCQHLGDAAVIFGFQADPALLFSDGARTIFVFNGMKPFLNPFLKLLHNAPMRRTPQDVTNFYDTIVTRPKSPVNKMYDIFLSLCEKI